MTSQTFGRKLKSVRREAKITQRKLAQKVGVDFSYISKLENDRLPPPAADTVVSIAQALNVDPNELLAMTGKLPTDVQDSVGKNQLAQRFLREAQELSLTDNEWGEMLDSLKRLRGGD